METTGGIIKIRVLKSGEITIDGSPTTMGDLEQFLPVAKAQKKTIWYYRDLAGAGPGPEAMQILKMIVDNKLPVSLSSNPDFSDYVDLEGKVHPRAEVLPEPPNVEEIFEKARQDSKAGKEVAVLRPDRVRLMIATPPRSMVPEAAIKGVESIVPSSSQRNIVVIADTTFAAGKQMPGLAEANQAIPFFGLLMGFACIGHAVWIFEGSAGALAAGCRDADLLVVDSGILPRLMKGWEGLAPVTMRNANIVVHDRTTHKLMVVKTAGATKGRLEFPN